MFHAGGRANVDLEVVDVDVAVAIVQLIGCEGMCEKEGCQNGGGHCHPICVVFCYHTFPQEFEPFIIRVLPTLLLV